MPTYTVDWTSHHTADWEKHLSHLKDKQAIGLEIGVFEGRSTAWFCQNILTHEKSRLICVDIFTAKDRYATFLKNLMENDLLHKVEVRRQPSFQMVLPPNYLDFGYIDGNHEASAVMTDSVLVWRSLKQGGVMIWDDVLWPGPNRKVPYLTPQPAIESFLHLYGSQLELLAKSHHAIIRKK
jgi:predicted O-methyltransferase YrrM